MIALCLITLWFLSCEHDQLLARELSSPVGASSPSLKVFDRPDDAGQALIIRWQRSMSTDATHSDESHLIQQYRLERAEVGEEFITLIHLPAEVTEFVDTNCVPDKRYRYRLIPLTADGRELAVLQSAEVSPVIQWFDTKRLWLAIFTATLSSAVMICTELSRRGKLTWVRPIAGLKAIDEAVGRATEMGKPILFVPGIMDLDQIETVAGITILSQVAKTAAIYDADLEVPTARSLVMTAAREAVQIAYYQAGRIEAYNPDLIYYVTDEQFGYVAYCCGWMARERPAACFYLGKFFAESLVLAEVGNAVGAIQIAGTAEAAQLPFFVAACDLLCWEKNYSLPQPIFHKIPNNWEHSRDKIIANSWQYS